MIPPYIIYTHPATLKVGAENDKAYQRNGWLIDVGGTVEKNVAEGGVRATLTTS